MKWLLHILIILILLAEATVFLHCIHSSSVRELAAPWANVIVLQVVLQRKAQRGLQKAFGHLCVYEPPMQPGASYPVWASSAKQRWGVFFVGPLGDQHSINCRKIRLSGKSVSINFLPDDASRVKLSNVDDDPCSDYINASYIPVSAPLGCRAQWSFDGWPHGRYLSSYMLSLLSGFRRQDCVWLP